MAEVTEDRVDLYCNMIHVACLGVGRVRRISPYAQDRIFLRRVERFLAEGQEIMDAIRAGEKAAE